MLTDHVPRAMHRPTCDLREANEGCYGEIPGFVGVWTSAPTLKGCRDELRSALEDWIVFSVAHRDPSCTFTNSQRHPWFGYPLPGFLHHVPTSPCPFVSR